MHVCIHTYICCSNTSENKKTIKGREAERRGWRLQQMLGHLQRPDPKQTQTKSDTQWPDHRDSTAHRDGWFLVHNMAASGSRLFVGFSSNCCVLRASVIYRVLWGCA